MYTFEGENPTEIYFDAMMALVEEGDEVYPRGKKVNELRPTSIEYLNPYNRFTFLPSRRINSFFQIAESLWILSGHADVEWLLKFNSNMGQFSDDGVWFNGPYGERIRHWGRNLAHDIDPENQLDQLYDCYLRLMADKDTRQATIVIGNPSFDNYHYLVDEKGKDICCNIYITFKVRHDKLNMTVFNRSNDLHWGVFGANLCQFSTIQELMLSWLKNSGNPEYENLEMGTYHQVTDSLHIYMGDYGSSITNEVMECYNSDSGVNIQADFSMVDEPHMSMDQETFYKFLDLYWDELDEYISNDEKVLNEDKNEEFACRLDKLVLNNRIDDYWYDALLSMLLYRLIRLKAYSSAMKILEYLEDSQAKVSMMYFLKRFINKIDDPEVCKEVVDSYYRCVDRLSLNIKNKEYVGNLRHYLSLDN